MDDSRLLADIAQGPLVTLSVNDTVGHARNVSREHAIHHFPVHRNKQLAGFVCICDMLEASDDTRVELVMTPGATILPDNASVREAAAVMQRTRKGSVLVMNEDGLSGIVTRADVVAWDEGAEALLDDARCECCGLRKHLRELEGHTLCAFCVGSTTEAEWLAEGRQSARG